MSALNCNACGCENNRDNCCCLSSIHVCGKTAESVSSTCCGDFREQDGDKVTNSMVSPKLTLDISCDAANCVHNSDSKCIADHIDISGLCAARDCDTVCSSFEHR